MGTLAAGSVVSVPFAFSDLSQSKIRPALVTIEIGSLKKEALEKVTDTVIEILREGLNTYKN